MRIKKTMPLLYNGNSFNKKVLRWIKNIEVFKNNSGHDALPPDFYSDEFSCINKHAMHIVRLYYTAFDILEKGEIITRRDKEREELLAIRNGKYLREDGSYAPEFFELVDALEKKFQDDVRKTSLPAKPDFGKIEELLVEINKEYLRRVM